jgi:ADP-dependent NAD(P)H-hydrate dehydratase
MSSIRPDDSPLVKLPRRSPESHKGTYGHALLIGGSRGMSGAIALSSLSCLRSGAGLVTTATAEAAQPAVAAHEPSLMTRPLPCDAQGRIALAAFEVLGEPLAAATAVGLGPGLGRSDELTELVGRLYKQVEQPLVVDADGLNALAQQPEVLSRAGGPRVLTPHPGEFGRLIGQTSLPHEERQSLAVQFAKRHNVVLVLKGHQTVITDGEQMALNHTGNPGMATGGTGDVLTGIITALLCQKLSPYDAARLGCHVHGVAGDLAAAELGQIAMIASDLIKYLPMAWQLIEAGEA